jgi:Coenzyme PQQ synthesis protein D (PqqD)
MKERVSNSSTIVVAKDQVSCDLAKEAIILNFKSGFYYGLNPVEARVWRLIQEPRTVRAVFETLLEEFDVEPGRCHRDLFALLEDMADKDLIVIEAERNGAD